MDVQTIRIIGFLFENSLHWQFEVETNSTHCYFRLHIYLHINTTLILFFICIWQLTKNRCHKNMYNYSKTMFPWRAKLIRIIGDPDNQLPAKWSSTLRPISYKSDNILSICLPLSQSTLGRSEQYEVRFNENDKSWVQWIYVIWSRNQGILVTSSLKKQADRNRLRQQHYSERCNSDLKFQRIKTAGSYRNFSKLYEKKIFIFYGKGLVIFLN
jgi:hypothetical protein